MEKTYEHQSLDGADQFRVLELQAAASRDDPLEFLLHRVSFDKHPRYAAISYTWDAQEFDQMASCDGQCFPISVNCSKILRQLRPPFTYDSVYIWIDQICIDQASQSDRAMNVRAMGAIYEQATSVLAWTGDFEKSMVEQLIAAAEEMGDMSSAPDTIIEHWVLRYNLQKRMAYTRQILDPKAVIADYSCQPRKRARINEEVLYTFRMQFPDRQWFQRLWTFQEGIVPQPHRVYFLIGKYMVPLDILNDRNYGSAHEFYSMRSTNRDREFADVIQTVRTRLCHDPRDRYFALYSVLLLANKDLYKDLPEPDYSKRTKDVFIEVAQWAFSSVENARFLYLATLSRDELNYTTSTATLPTWVPDLHRLSLVQRKNRSNLLPNRETKYNASPRSKANLIVSAERWFGRESLHVLTLRGIVVDIIDMVTDEIPTEAQPKHSTSWQEKLKKILGQFLFGAFRLGVFDKKTWMSVTNSFWMAALHSTQLSAIMPWQEQCLRYIFSEKASLTEETKALNTFRRLIKDNNGNVLQTLNVSQDFWPLHGAQYPAAGRSSQSFATIFSEIEKHEVIITRDHRCGVAIGDVQKGDKIAIVSGFCKPLILRKMGTFFSLIGHGFIDGIMEGEAWPKDERALEDILIV